MEDVNLTPEGLSERWNGVPLTTLSRWRWTGTGPIFMKFGKHVSYKLADVRRFEEERRRRDTTCFAYDTSSRDKVGETMEGGKQDE